MRHIELGNLVVDFKEGDVLVFDSIKDITPLYPLKPTTTLIAICCNGGQRITANGQDLLFTKGNILLCPPKENVRCHDHSPDFDCKVLLVTENLVRGLLRDKVDVWRQDSYINQFNIINIPDLCEQVFPFYFTLLHAKLKNNNSTTPYEILLALLRALMLEIHFILRNNTTENHEQKISQGKLLFNRFLSLISDSKVKRQPITHYADMLAITPKYLTMLCLKYSDKTASEWVAQYTVDEIRFYLKSTELSIKEISALLGFSNMSHFGSYVRKHLGVSPTEFRYNKKELLLAANS